MKENNQYKYEHNLLVIDDEVEITKSLFRQFRRQYNVFIANSAEEALPILEREDIQVVLSDQRMPGMSGITFFSAIKDKYPDALKMILTGYSDIDAVIDAINEGQVFRYLTKPWNPVELNLAIEEAFERHDLISNNKVLLQKLQEANSTLEKKVMERTKDLESANDDLTKLNVEKNKYVGMVAHDLRNPIGNALSFAKLLISDYTDFTQSQHLKYLKVINERCYYALNLIESFLDISKIESGILGLHTEKNDYCTFVKSCISQNELFAHKKSQEIIFNCESPKTILSFDKNKIEQVLSNLIGNAIKYSYSTKKIWVNIEIQNNHMVTHVIDEGQGIPEDELPNVFKAFKTSSSKPTDDEKSTGLGLAIVKKIIEAHKGSISVKSTLNIGSDFSFSLPIE